MREKWVLGYHFQVLGSRSKILFPFSLGFIFSASHSSCENTFGLPKPNVLYEKTYISKKHAGYLHQVSACFLGISQILCVLLKHAGRGHRCIQPEVLRIEFQRFLSKYIVSQIESIFHLLPFSLISFYEKLWIL